MSSLKAMYDLLLVVNSNHCFKELNFSRKLHFVYVGTVIT